MRISLALALCLLAVPFAAAQQRLGYVDSQAILATLPEYQSAQQEVDRLATQWQGELDAMGREVEAMEQEFSARELLYTAEERTRRLDDIRLRRQEMDQFRRRRFGADGDLFREQQQRMRPIQERVLEAIQIVAEEGNYDYVFDRTGDLIFLYAKPQHNLTDLVLDELGVDPLRRGGTQ
ncbi:MAG TPA: OmpH family outer membrane protein [Rubricoccaceae bacterium]|nr:OmpH family outer membrane protein [Rubricoccaceae bacterium]